MEPEGNSATPPATAVTGIEPPPPASAGPRKSLATKNLLRVARQSSKVGSKAPAAGMMLGHRLCCFGRQQVDEETDRGDEGLSALIKAAMKKKKKATTRSLQHLLLVWWLVAPLLPPLHLLLRHVWPPQSWPRAVK